MKKSKKEVLTGFNYHLLTIVMCTAIMIFLFCIVANATDEDLTNNIEQKGVENTVTSESDAEKTEANETTRVTDNTDKQEVSSRADIPRVNGSWLHDSNGWYFYNSGGEKQKGFCYINNNKYCFEENDGLMRISWQYIDNVYYYFGGINDGAAKIGWQVINGKWYYFNESGIMQTGMKRVGNGLFYFGGERDGSMKTGWEYLDNQYYYFGKANDGVMKIGWQIIDGSWYYFDGTGVMQSGLKRVGNGLFYFGGARDGAMKTGWQNLDGDWYYFNDSGAAVNGWLQLNSMWYYFNPDYKMVKDTIMTIDGRKFAFDPWGGMLKGKFNINGKPYFTNAYGAIITRLNGIDVSNWQGNIDWNRIANSEIDFAIIKAGYRGKMNGTLAKDSKFDQNVKGALAAGLSVGAYVFSEAMNYSEGAEEARYLVSLVKNYNIQLPLVIDTENQGGRSSNISVRDRTEAMRGFCETIQLLGYTPMIYASTSWLNNNLDMSKLNNYKVWVAQYYDRVTYKGNYEFWQYTSKGRVDGISGNVDMNYWYNTKE